MATMEAIAVKERPILFSGEMVRAILDGRKTQTRRVVKPQPEPFKAHDRLGPFWWFNRRAWGLEQLGRIAEKEMPWFLAPHCPYGQPGDRLWVRENLRQDPLDGLWKYEEDFTPLIDLEDEIDAVGWVVTRKRDYCPSIHMPRWASRITLEITDVRVERVQEISEADARAEGAEPRLSGTSDWGPIRSHRTGFVYLWNQINEARGYGWLANPWVWCLTFRRIES